MVLLKLLQSFINTTLFMQNTITLGRCLECIFMSGKGYELYLMVLTCLKESATAAGLELKPKIITCDFVKGAKKAFKYHFPSVKILGWLFHLTSAINKKIGD